MNGYNFFTDGIQFLKQRDKFPNCLTIRHMLAEKYGAANIPPIVGLCYLGTPRLWVTSSEPMQDILVTKNKFNTKSGFTKVLMGQFMSGSLLFD